MKHKSVLRYLIYITELSLSLITPIILCVWISYLISKRFSLGFGSIIIGLFIGLCAACLNLYKFFRMMQNEANNHKKEDENGRL